MRTLIIAEAGVNHNGDMNIAKKLIEAAADAGADYVKFQTFVAKNLVSKHAAKADYQKKQTGEAESQLDMISRLELSEDQHYELIEHCKKKNIAFLSTAFDLESIDLLARLNIRLGKIPSGEITNYPYLVKMARVFDRIILSTGMSDMNDIEAALTVLMKNGKKPADITVLHCNTEYPTPMRDVNLRAMSSIKDRFKTGIGYSDHTLGIEVPVAAVALGASVIEKHFTLSRTMEGPDHSASLEPDELKHMISAIRNIELALGSSEKKASESEKKNMPVARKSIVAGKFIAKGEKFTEENLAVKRPGNGLNPMRWEEVIGKTADRDFFEDDLIEI